MAAWNVGPFDNDYAVDWCANLEDLEPGQRAELVRHTLATAVSAGAHLPEAAAAEYYSRGFAFSDDMHSMSDGLGRR